MALFCDIYHFTPQTVVVDAHPGYVSHQLGETLAAQWNIPCVDVLHHHAHLVACLAEHGWPREGGAVIGVALDGLGYGADGQLWGGECLRVDYTSCEYIGGLPAVALPGGDLASRQPWRNLLAQLQRYVPIGNICLRVRLFLSQREGYWRGRLSGGLMRRWPPPLGAYLMQ